MDLEPRRSSPQNPPPTHPGKHHLPSSTAQGEGPNLRAELGLSCACLDHPTGLVNVPQLWQHGDHAEEEPGHPEGVLSRIARQDRLDRLDFSPWCSIVQSVPCLAGSEPRFSCWDPSSSMNASVLPKPTYIGVTIRSLDGCQRGRSGEARSDFLLRTGG